MNAALRFDIAAFVVLFALSALVRSRFKHHGYSATAAFGIVMAIGIFADFSLPQLPFYLPLLARLITLELLVIWLFLAGSYAASALNRHFRMHIAHPLRRFAIGTWVAGTAVLSALATHALPQALWLDKALALVAVAMYLPYVAVFVYGYARLARHPLKQDANGVILLATVSTQSIVIALHTAFGVGFPVQVAMGMVAFDMIFLCSGLVLIALHYHAVGSWLLAVEWKNANCIVHGAVSITGLALVLTSNFGPDVLLGVWEVALVLFVVIEVLEFMRLCEREHRRGWRRGLLVYDTTQWTRNFTYGMFYAFSLMLYRHLSVASSPTGDLWYPVLRAVAEWGQYVVLVALLVEIAIFLRARLHRFHPPGMAA
ncbi:MAG: hypothetical protein ACRESG_04475 [Gammaproteobacteria bacterium]